MKFKDYLNDKVYDILIYLFNTILIVVLLFICNINLYIIILIGFIMLINLITIISINYFRKYKFYNNLINNIKELDQKYYILETIPEANTYEEKIMVNVLYDINKSMIENINSRERNINDFKEFVELWIHEVKLPISSLVLKCHNNKDIYSDNFISQIRKLDNYVDEVLYYVRSENPEKDFIINEVNLKDVVKKVIIKNKDDLLENNIDIKSNVKNIKVNTDSKWLEFIINQLISNCIKYKSDNSIIEIDCYLENDRVYLTIYDNGIGISSEDVSRVFEKSFTGKNGRNSVKSTGMGLYIVNNLCNKLGHKISIESEINNYTKVIIEFGNNDLYSVTKL